jgi:hypothetical protein
MVVVDVVVVGKVPLEWGLSLRQCETNGVEIRRRPQGLVVRWRASRWFQEMS